MSLTNTINLIYRLGIAFFILLMFIFCYEAVAGFTFRVLSFYIDNEKYINLHQHISLLMTQIFFIVCMMTFLFFKGSLRVFFSIKKTTLRHIILFLFLVLLLLGVESFYAYMANVNLFNESSLMPYSSGYYQPVWWFSAIVLAPLLEEIFFRGILYNLFNAVLTPVLSIIIISIVWTFIHPENDIRFIIGFFMSGMIFGYARLVTGSIVMPILIHAVNNILVTLLILINISN